MLGLGLTGYIPIVVYVAGLLVMLVSVVYSPVIGLAFLIPLLPLQNVLVEIHEFPAGKDFVDIMVASLFIGLLLRSNRAGHRFLEKTRFNLLVAFMIVFTFGELLLGSSFLGVELFNLDDPRVVSWKNYMLLPLLYLLSVNIVRDKGTMKLIIVVMVLSMIAMDLNFINYFKWVKKWHFTYKMRTAGTFVHLGPNELAAFYVQYTMVLIGLLLHTKQRSELAFWGITIFANMYCVLFLFSRAAYLSAAVGVSFLLLMANRKLLSVFVIFLCLSFWFMPVSVKERISMTVNDPNAAGMMVGSDEEDEIFDASVEARFDFWKLAVRNFKKRPILGSGYGTYPYLEGVRRDTHSMYLNVLAEMGGIGFTIVIIVLYLSFKNGWELYRSTEDYLLKGLGLGFCGCVLTCAISNIFGNRWSYIELGAFYWVFLGLVVRGKLIAEELDSAEEPSPAEEKIVEGLREGELRMHW